MGSYPRVRDVDFEDRELLRNVALKIRAAVPPSSVWSVFSVRLAREPNATDADAEWDLDLVKLSLAGAYPRSAVFSERPFQLAARVDEFILAFPLDIEYSDLSSKWFGPRITVHKIISEQLPDPSSDLIYGVGGTNRIPPPSIANHRPRGRVRGVLHGSGHSKNYDTVRYEALVKMHQEQLRAIPDIFPPNGESAVYMMKLHVVTDEDIFWLESDIRFLRRKVTEYASINDIKFNWHLVGEGTHGQYFFVFFPEGGQLVTWDAFEPRITTKRVMFGQKA